jgi:hypothetical protein
MAGGAMAQKNVLVLEKPGNKKSFKYFEGDKIELRTKDSLTVKGLVSAIKDTVIVINFYTEVRVSRIAEIQRTRWGVSILSKILMAGGAAMVLVESINGAISSDGNINMNYLYYGAGAAAAGALLIPLQKSHYVIAPEKWKVKILPVDQQFNYQKNKTIQF